jgi:hypothetical protein
VTRSDYVERAEPFEHLVDRAATDVAVEEVPDLFSGEAVGRSLQNLAGAIGNGVSDAGAEEGRGRRPNGLRSPVPERMEDTADLLLNCQTSTRLSPEAVHGQAAAENGAK